MHPRLRAALERWVGAGLLDAATAERLRAFEAREEPRHRLRWPAILAIALGGLLLGAGVLLFVSAHWDSLSPAARFAVVLAMVALFHAGALAAAPRFAALATVLHAVGTTALGAGIFLAGQIFNLAEHWPGGVMLWALGAAIGWALLRDPAQAGLLALLAPAWLASEWWLATERLQGGWTPMMQGLTLLAATYLTARTPERDGPTRRVLAWIGGLAILPVVILLCLPDFASERELALTQGQRALAWLVGLGAPLVLALLLRGRAAWMNGAAAAWVVVLAFLARRSFVAGVYGPRHVPLSWGREMALYAWLVLGALALVAWGLAEARRERINLGVAGFAIVIGCFYFSSVMDKLGRSTSLVGLGLLFLLGGWLLERARRRLLARLESAP